MNKKSILIYKTAFVNFGEGQENYVYTMHSLREKRGDLTLTL